MLKFLIIRFSSIGDIVLTTAAIRCLRKQYPDAGIHFLTKQAFRGLVADNPNINKVITLEDDFDAMVDVLKKEAYDHIIDLHHNLRTLRIKRALKKVPASSFNKLNIEKWLLVNLKINILPNKHIVDRTIECMHGLGVKDDGQGLDYFIPERDKVRKEDIPTAHQLGYIGIVIGAALNTKKLPLQKIKEICKAIDHPIILLGGKEDYLDGKEIAMVDEIKLYNACGKFSLNESADIVRNAKFIITHDTGLMHIAAAFQKPIISVWGNTIPGFGMYPYYGKRSTQQYEVVEIKKLRCRPCSKIGYKKCPKGHFKCMQLIAVNEIVKLVDMRLKG